MAVGVVVAVVTKLTGEPGDVELLVDNIHVLGGADDVRCAALADPGLAAVRRRRRRRSGPEAPLVQTTGTLGSWLGRQARLDRTECAS